ncbi:hypothetical protein Tco_0568426 [Tanacetum coccineum]
MSDSEDSTVTYTEISSPYEDLSDIGSPGAEGPIFQDPPSPDYVPGPEEPEQAPPSPIYVPFVPEPVYPEFLPKDDVLPVEEQPLPVAASPTTKSPGYIPKSDHEEDPDEDDEEDPEEDPADYPADKGDDRDDEEPSDDDDDDDDAEKEHLAPADPAAVAYSADQDPYLAYRVTAWMSIRPQAPTPFLSEEVAERLLALPTTRPSPLSPYSSPLPQIPSLPLQATRIRQRGRANTISVHEMRCLEICLPPSITWDDLEDEIIYSQLDDARHDRALLRARVNMLYRDRPFHRRNLPSDGGGRPEYLQSEITELHACKTVVRTDGDYRSAESRPSKTETVSGGTKDSEEPQDSDDRASETAGTC